MGDKWQSISACPETYARWFCLNGATCFKVSKNNTILYNCWCQRGYQGLRCDYKYISRAPSSSIHQTELTVSKDSLEVVAVGLESHRRMSSLSKALEHQQDSLVNNSANLIKIDGQNVASHSRLATSVANQSSDGNSTSSSSSSSSSLNNLIVIISALVLLFLLIRLVRRSGSSELTSNQSSNSYGQETRRQAGGDLPEPCESACCWPKEHLNCLRAKITNSNTNTRAKIKEKQTIDNRKEDKSLDQNNTNSELVNAEFINLQYSQHDISSGRIGENGASDMMNMMATRIIRNNFIPVNNWNIINAKVNPIIIRQQRDQKQLDYHKVKIVETFSQKGALGQAIHAEVRARITAKPWPMLQVQSFKSLGPGQQAINLDHHHHHHAGHHGHHNHEQHEQSQEFNMDKEWSKLRVPETKGQVDRLLAGTSDRFDKISSQE